MYLQTLTIIISLSALSLSLFTFLRHDAKIKRQTKLLNQLQLEKLNRENLSEKKANIEANVIKREKGKRIIKVYNKGKAIAKNTVITFSPYENVFISEFPSPIDIKPQHSIEVDIQKFIGSPNILQINFEWEDVLNNSNKDRQTLQI